MITFYLALKIFLLFKNNFKYITMAQCLKPGVKIRFKKKLKLVLMLLVYFDQHKRKK